MPRKKTSRKKAAGGGRTRSQVKRPGPSPNLEVMPMEEIANTMLPAAQRESLTAWFNLYMGVEGAATSENTVRAKVRDLETFLGFLDRHTGVDHPDQWTRVVTDRFIKHLRSEKRRSASTVNRALATLKHASRWIEKQRPFLAGNPCERIQELQVEEPEWKGLTDEEIAALRAAAESRLTENRRGQQPIRDYALLLVLLRTGLRISELLALELDQLKGKYLVDVQRKGRMISRQVFLAEDALNMLKRYIREERGRESGPLFCTRTGNGLARQNVDEALKKVASEANQRREMNDAIEISAHVLRHTMLRKAAQKHGVQYAKELSGHASDRYIWRYVQPSQEEKEKALEGLFEDS